MTRIFITGGSSAIGQCVVRELIGHNHNVTALTHRKSLPGGLPVKTIGGSILEPESYKAVALDAEVILHLAGLSHSIYQNNMMM